ncbi:N-acyl-D-amino-acid deacylase [Streptomyces himastatinicus ATCC 53653]|uniref:N-acyl-D-amino-acid deacylase n=1 Tax=Streptomyces himastatinicus ATCC 53653 TaxID=457427 RepID=D9WJV2_9ACTN|nr:amidohydrolase family protein [Streptomyces himastatinicus]EFL23515.1 N-acyl-D-amino-acid deacylase [Streptomyces himastatinicus ATCC 53653]
MDTEPSAAAADGAPQSVHDLVLSGGRVIDPETGLDAVRHIAVDDGRIVAIAEEPLRAQRVVDVTGRVVAPGFIDLHSHALTPTSMRLQALDGVTTALELEAGAPWLEGAYRDAALDGRPINYGYSASWAAARMSVMDDLDPRTLTTQLTARMGGRSWGAPGTPDDVRRILDRLEAELELGALGIGVLIGYAPDASHREYLDVARLAARYGVPTYTHARHKNSSEPGTALQGIQEIVAVGLGTGAHMHLCHINSTSLQQIDVVTELVGNARAHGVQVTTEAYPYGASMTAIGAPFLHPDNLPRLGITPSHIVHTPTGERPATASRLMQLRVQDPGAPAIIQYLDESRADEQNLLRRALLFDDTMIASDAMPLQSGDGKPLTGTEWPPPSDAVTHPRSTGTFARTLRVYVRETGLLTLPEVIRRATLLPARVLERACPDARRKGRVQPGADADLVVFDPLTVHDRSTYEHPTRPSDGFQHVLVGGEFVVRDGEIDLDATPGRSLRGARG